MADQTAAATAPVFDKDEAAEIVSDMAGGAAVAPDLSAAELLPTVGGATDDSKRKSTFALLKAEGAALPSASSKFVGTTPKAAVMKAARRIHKRTDKTEFSVLMRRVASHKVDKKLYKYSVTMKRRSRPTGFVTLIDPRFVVEKEVKKKGVVTKKVGDVELNVAKKVPIVAESEHPVYGYVAEDGTLAKGDAATGAAKFVVVRPADTNTLYLVVPGAIPDAINGVTVVKTDWDVASLEDAPITDEEREEYDIAGRAKTQGDEDAKKKSETAKAAAEKRKLKTREDKAKAKEALKAKREKERAKKEAAKAKAAEKKAKAAEKKAAAAAKKAAKKSA
jgi:hypothetical protein